MIRMNEVGAFRIKDAEKMLSLVPKGIEIASSNSMNRAIVAARTIAVKMARATYNVSAADLKSRTNIKRASVSKLSASFRSDGPAMSLLRFKISHSAPTNRPTVISVAVKKGAMKPLPGHFVVAQPKGGLGTFKRTGKRGLPIERDYGPSIPQMIGSKESISKIEDRAWEIFEIRLDREVDRLLSK